MRESLAKPFAAVLAHLKKAGGWRGPSEVSREDFRLELAELGLLGRAFSPGEYRACLEKKLGVEILIEEIPDERNALIISELVLEGIMAEVVYSEDLRRAMVLVRESLRYQPWPAYELSLFHELSHLAAGHPVRLAHARRKKERQGVRLGSLRSRLGRRSLARYQDAQYVDELRREVFEPEAQKRAEWLVLACTHPVVFEGEGADQVV